MKPLKAKTLESDTLVYHRANCASPIVCKLKLGSEVELGIVFCNDRGAWLKVTTPGGATGYVLGNVKVRILLEPRNPSSNSSNRIIAMPCLAL